MEWHVALALEGGAKLFIILVLVPVTTIECEGTNITISGSQGVDAEPWGTSTEELTVATGVKCPFNIYTNDDDVMLTGGLTSEVGGLKAKSCQEVQGAQKFNSIFTPLGVMAP